LGERIERQRQFEIALGSKQSFVGQHGYVRLGCAFRSSVDSMEFSRGPLDPNCCRGTEYATLLRSPSRDGVAADLGLRIGGRYSSAHEAPSLHPRPLVAKAPER
jgi:hypothetical protein